MLVCFGGMEGGGLLDWVREMGAGGLRRWVWFGAWSVGSGGGRRMIEAVAEAINNVRTAEDRRRIIVRWNAYSEALRVIGKTTYAVKFLSRISSCA